MFIRRKFLGVSAYKEGRKVRVFGHRALGVITHVIAREYANVRVSLEGAPAGIYVTPLDLTPLCNECQRPEDEHDATTGKCLFGAGRWT